MGEHGGDRARPRFHGVPLDDFRAQRARVFGGGIEQRNAHASSAKLPRHEETDDGPDGAVVERPERASRGQPGKCAARSDRAPADWTSVAVGDHADGFAHPHESPEGVPVLRPLPALVLRPRQPVPHAPAAAAGTALAEQPLEIVPALRPCGLDAYS